ncbi:hypothetical protein ACP70R_045202 [Stipagrostis hirtigluma subsp. patula]
MAAATERRGHALRRPARPERISSPSPATRFTRASPATPRVLLPRAGPSLRRSHMRRAAVDGWRDLLGRAARRPQLGAGDHRWAARLNEARLHVVVARRRRPGGGFQAARHRRGIQAERGVASRGGSPKAGAAAGEGGQRGGPGLRTAATERATKVFARPGPQLGVDGLLGRAVRLPGVRAPQAGGGRGGRRLVDGDR